MKTKIFATIVLLAGMMPAGAAADNSFPAETNVPEAAYPRVDDA